MKISTGEGKAGSLCSVVLWIRMGSDYTRLHSWEHSSLPCVLTYYYTCKARCFNENDRHYDLKQSRRSARKFLWVWRTDIGIWAYIWLTSKSIMDFVAHKIQFLQFGTYRQKKWQVLHRTNHHTRHYMMVHVKFIFLLSIFKGKSIQFWSVQESLRGRKPYADSERWVRLKR